MAIGIISAVLHYVDTMVVKFQHFHHFQRFNVKDLEICEPKLVYLNKK